MYEAYFNIQKRPFSSTPDASCFFAPESIQEIFDELILRAESGQGIGILTAPAGTGKTLLCRRLAAELASRWTPIFLANASFPTRRALLQAILFELGQRYSGMDEQELRLSIFGSLRELTLAGRGAVVIVDEAHLLSDRLLEELRLVGCLAEGKLPLARVILAGQPALEERMMEPALEALNQRVACHVYLEPLSRRQSIEYVEHCIKWAGGICPLIFTDSALESIAAIAGGLPRCLNQLCDHALLLAFVQEQPRVTREIVDEALAALRQLPLRWNTPVAAEQVGNLSGEDYSDEAESDFDDSRSDEILSDEDENVCGSPRSESRNVEIPAYDQPVTLATESIARDQSSVFQESVNSFAGTGETVCIEIGGDLAIPDMAIPDASYENQENTEYASNESVTDMDELVLELEESTMDSRMMDASTVSRMQGRFVSEQVVPHRSVAVLKGAGVVPLPDASPVALRGMVDELVDDPYARLDSGSPRLLRTFDDAAVPENWLPTKRSDIPAAPQPPKMPDYSDVDMSYEKILAVIDEQLDAAPQFVDSILNETNGDELIVEEPISLEIRALAPPMQEPVEIDDLLGSSVMDACLEAQAAIDGDTGHKNRDTHWWNDPASTADLDDHIVMPETLESFESEYDVIEPGLGAREEKTRQPKTSQKPGQQKIGQKAPFDLQSRQEQATDSHSQETPAQGRYVPKPKYRNVFSTLRRRIGRGT